MKKVLFVQRSETPHWVGDGFPVRNLFSYNDIAKEISPFLMLDYAGPADFPPNNSNRRRGVDTHPHRGFETVTIVYEGEVEHRDSAGGGGVIENGDVQWMTAASGLVHEERHGKNFSKTGGRFEMVQLWVNLPAKDKMTKPRYQGLKKSDIPVVELPNAAGTLRVIAGEFVLESVRGAVQGSNRLSKNTVGPAKTFSPINIWDLKLNSGADVELKVRNRDTALILVLSGQVRVGDEAQTVKEAELAVLDPNGDTVKLTALSDTKILFLGGTPLNEPVVGYGPFVMNTRAEILQAMQDYEAGKMGSFDSIEGSER